MQPQKSIVVKKYWKAIFWNLAVIFASLIPADEFSGSGFKLFPHADKVVHFIMYAGLTFFILESSYRIIEKSKRKSVLIFTVLYAFFTGFFLEILQNSFLIGRNFDIFDVLANTTGIIVAVVWYKMFHH